MVRMVRRPLVPLLWLVAVGIVAAASTIPVVGALAWLLGPALAARFVLGASLRLGY